MSMTRTQAEAVAAAIAEMIRHPDGPHEQGREALVEALVGVRPDLTSRQVIGDPNA